MRLIAIQAGLVSLALEDFEHRSLAGQFLNSPLLLGNAIGGLLMLATESITIRSQGRLGLAVFLDHPSQFRGPLVEPSESLVALAPKCLGLDLQGDLAEAAFVGQPRLFGLAVVDLAKGVVSFLANLVALGLESLSFQPERVPLALEFEAKRAELLTVASPDRLIGDQPVSLSLDRREPFVEGRLLDLSLVQEPVLLVIEAGGEGVELPVLERRFLQPSAEVAGLLTRSLGMPGLGLQTLSQGVPLLKRLRELTVPRLDVGEEPGCLGFGRLDVEGHRFEHRADVEWRAARLGGRLGKGHVVRR